MFSAFLQQIGGYFDRRWLLSVFFPSLVFWTSLLSVYSGARGLDLVLDEWRSLSTEQQVVLPVAGLIGLSFFAYFLSTVQLKILRLFEGYWEGVPGLHRLAGRRRGYHVARYQYLHARSQRLLWEITAAEQTEPNGVGSAGGQPRPSVVMRREQEGVDLERFTTLPGDVSHVLPTALGNILRAAEFYPNRRYGLDGVLLWPRLQPFLPESLLSALGSSRTGLEATVNVALLAGVFTLGAGSLVALFSSDRLLFAACLLGVPVAWASYLAALASGVAYSDLVRSSFDLYRGQLLEGLGFQAPTEYAQELAIWRDVNGLIQRGYPPVAARYTNAPKPAPEPPVKQGWWTRLRTRLSRGRVRTSSVSEVLASRAPGTPSSPAAKPPDPVRPQDRRSALALALFVVLFGFGGLWLTGQLPWTAVTVPVAGRDLPPYHVIVAADVQGKRVDRFAVPANAVASDADLIGRVTLAPVGSNALVRRQQVRALTPGVTLDGTVAVAVAVPASSIAGAALQAGDVVDVTVPATEAAGQVHLERVVVLQVPPVATTAGDRAPTAEPTTSVLIAVPQASVSELARRDPREPVLISRAL